MHANRNGDSEREKGGEGRKKERGQEKKDIKGRRVVVKKKK